MVQCLWYMIMFIVDFSAFKFLLRYYKKSERKLFLQYIKIKFFYVKALDKDGRRTTSKTLQKRPFADVFKNICS